MGWIATSRPINSKEKRFVKSFVPYLSFDNREIGKFDSDHTYDIIVIAEKSYENTKYFTKELNDVDGGPVFLMIRYKIDKSFVGMQLTRMDGEPLKMKL